MRIINAARHTVADFSVAMDVDGREYLVLAIKATYRIPQNGRKPRPLIPPQPLFLNDVYVGEPYNSAPLAEADFCLHKPRCDVIFNASAHVPNNIPVNELVVSVKVGSINKSLKVVGDRRWQKNAAGYCISRPEPFTRMPLHYGRAFGGFYVCSDAKQERIEAYSDNTLGVGFSEHADGVLLEGKALPNLLPVDQIIISPTNNITPIALSALPRSSPVRRRYAGTYDEEWRQNVFPFLPYDFDERYFQCAPPDQQIDFPKGGEQVELINIVPNRPRVYFRLPRLDNMKAQVLTADYGVIKPDLVVDTLYFETDQGRFSAVWRAAIPIKRNIKEFDAIAIGSVCKDCWGKKSSELGLYGGCRGKGADISRENDS